MHSIIYDHQAFSLQEYGGVSRYFCELAPRIHRTEDFSGKGRRADPFQHLSPRVRGPADGHLLPKADNPEAGSCTGQPMQFSRH